MEPKLFFSTNTEERPLLPESLNDLCMKYGTDKALHPDKIRHGYAVMYEPRFAKWREEDIRMLEIGIAAYQFPYASFNVWLDYFTKAEVWGLDNFINGKEEDLKREMPNINTMLGRGGNFVFATQAEKECLDKFFSTLNKPFDLIIDDGSHKAAHMWTTLEASWDYLVSGGEYYIEDIAGTVIHNEELLRTFMPGVLYDRGDTLKFVKSIRNPSPQSKHGKQVLDKIWGEVEDYSMALDQRGASWLLLIRKKG